MKKARCTLCAPGLFSFSRQPGEGTPYMGSTPTLPKASKDQATCNVVELNSTAIRSGEVTTDDDVSRNIPIRDVLRIAGAADSQFSRRIDARSGSVYPGLGSEIGRASCRERG